MGEAEEWGGLGGTSDPISHQPGFPWQALHITARLPASALRPADASQHGAGPIPLQALAGLPPSSLSPPDSGALLTSAPRFLGQRWPVYLGAGVRGEAQSSEGFVGTLESQSWLSNSGTCTPGQGQPCAFRSLIRG